MKMNKGHVQIKVDSAAMEKDTFYGGIKVTILSAQRTPGPIFEGCGN
jgi:hypothetical protein